MLRYVYDRTHCGMVLIGTKVAREEIESTTGEFYKFFGQTRKRGQYVFQIPLVPSRADMVKALDRVGLEWPRSRKVEDTLVHLAKDGIGVVITYLDAARDWAAKNTGRPCTWDNFITAHDIIRDMGLEQNETEAIADLRRAA
jgi:hypothetical protein